MPPRPKSHTTEEAKEAGRAAAQWLNVQRQPAATPPVPVPPPKRAASGELEESAAKRAREAEAAKRAASGELEEPAFKRAREADTREPADEPGGASTPAGSAPTPAGDAPIATAGDVPVEPAEPPKAPTKPAVPTAEARDTDTFAAMRGIIRYVQHYLFARLASHPQFKRTAALHEQPPLTIQAATDALRELISYKHPWTPEEAAQSLASTGRYEAGGNITWLNPFPTSTEAANSAGPAPTWESVHLMADQFRVSQDPASTQETGRVAKEKRLLFRAPVQVHASTLEALTKTSFPGTLDLVSGHVIMYGWYVAMFEALDASGSGAEEWMLALWQAGLTISIHAQVVTDPAELAALSLKASNDVFTWEKACGDSFPSFALKIAQFCEPVKGQPIKERMQHIKDVRFKGTLVARTCLLGALKYVAEVDGDTHDLVVRFERRFGKGVFTDKWNNVTQVLQACSGHVEQAGTMWSESTSSSSLFALVVHYLWWALKHEEVTPAQVTKEWLLKKDDGTPGTVNLVLCKALLVSQIAANVAELPESSTLRQELASVLEKFQNYTCFDAAFQQRDSR